jgi:hypothetical protein
MSGSIFSANTIAGIPVIEAKSDYTVNLDPFGNGGVSIGGTTSQASAMSGSGTSVSGSGMTTRYLSDYEEGVIQTPLIIGGNVIHRYTDASGESIPAQDNKCFYIKIGNKVDVWYLLDSYGVNLTECTGIAGSEVGTGAIQLMLPYTSISSHYIQNAQQMYMNGSSAVIYSYLVAKSGYVGFYTNADQTTTIDAADGEAVGNRVIFRNHFTYHLF